jgi:hypothetical protein
MPMSIRAWFLPARSIRPADDRPVAVHDRPFLKSSTLQLSEIAGFVRNVFAQNGLFSGGTNRDDQNPCGVMRNVPRTAVLCLALALSGKIPAVAQEAVATPEEEERARAVLRAGLDENAVRLQPFDPRSAKMWDMPPAADIAPGLHADLFRPSTEILSLAIASDWLPGAVPQQNRAASTVAPPEDLAEPSATASPPAPSEKPREKAHSVLRSGRASVVGKSPPEKSSAPRPRKKAGPAAPKAPALTLPGELRP